MGTALAVVHVVLSLHLYHPAAWLAHLFCPEDGGSNPIQGVVTVYQVA
jgi:hypothetical protein